MALVIGSRIIDLISIAYQANRPVLLIGGTGVGKSEILEQAAAEFELDYIMRDLSLMEPSDLVGIPQIEDGRTRFAPPGFLPTGGRGLLVLEELNRAPPYMLAPTLELLTARRLNDYILPPGWLPVAAINPAHDGYSGTRQLDAALEARFMRIEVAADKQEWLAWAGRNGIHVQVINFVHSMPDIFAATTSNPRAWAAVSAVLAELESSRADQDMRFNCIAGLVGAEMATAFLSFLDQGGVAIPEAEDLLERYADFSSAIKILAAKNDTAILNKLVKSVVLMATDPKRSMTKSQRKRWCANLAHLRMDLPAEFRSQLAAIHAELSHGS